MISAWDVYWVMQLDSIRSAVGLLALGGFAAAVVLTVWNGLSRFDAVLYPSLCNREEREGQWRTRDAIRRKALFAAVPLVLIASLIPSTKTAAAMLILPAVANNEAIQQGAGDLYRLAKRALEDAVSDAAKPRNRDAK